MTEEQIQALEALYTAAHGRHGTLVDLNRVPFTIKTSTLDELRQQGVTRTAGRASFSLTMQGANKAVENRHVPPVDD